MQNSKIEWTDHTFNPWMGCQKVSPGCDNCYAEGMMAHRFGKVEWGPRAERVRTSKENWRKPLSWAKHARVHDERPRVFCASLADLFDNRVPHVWRQDLFELIDATPELDWLLLTKRPENIEKMLASAAGQQPWPWPNVWLGTTAEDQHHYVRRWRILRETPAVVRFISYEPALGPLVLDEHVERPTWIICGGESGPNARLMKKRWARNLRDQCSELEIAFFMKQMTGKKPIPDDLMVRQFPRILNLDIAD